MALSPHVIEEIKALPARYPQPRSAVMPALDLAQEELGYLTPEAMTEVATALQLDAGYVEGVATFYSLFHLEPIGKHRFYMCTNLSCTLRGAEEMVEHLRGAIGVHEAGEVSKDGLFSYEEVECMGACEYAPMCRIDHRYHYDLTPEKLDALVAERRNPSFAPVQAPAPHPPAAPATSPASGAVTDQTGHFPARGEGGAPAPDGETESPPAPKKARTARKKKADA
jgi:NADH-quinone oxidoreductase subunit E